ncbi:MAG TPA: peptidylprolyl isomerase [Candidatus Paceibacterota bacterium]|nr:peptidylprolyl isomerase [Candidatus Paceibacterota bacterium]
MDRSVLIIFPILLALALGAWWYLGHTPNGAPSLGYATTTPEQGADANQNFGAPTDTSQPQQGSSGSQPAGANSSSPVSTTNQQTIMHATLHTSLGDITIEFDNAAPQTVANFVKLAQSGYYNGVKFHRVIKGFMDQAGDPLTKDDSQQARWGTGGPGYTIPDENMSGHNAAGVVSMANTGQPNSGGSQFFINAVDNSFLDGKYAVFAKVTAGMDVVEAINNAATDSSDRPTTPIVINSVDLSN